MLYNGLKKIASIFFNILNILLLGNLPTFACVCTIVEDQGRYLVLERSQGDVVFPGGFMRWKEQPEQAARREAKEETGVDLRIGDVIGYSSKPTVRHNYMSTLTIIYSAEIVGGELRSSIEGHPCWLDKATLHSRLDEANQHIFNEYVRYRKQYRETNIS